MDPEDELVVAICAGNADAVGQVLDTHPDLRHLPVGDRNEPPLFLACRKNQVEVLPYLAEPRTERMRGSSGESALHVACEAGSIEAGQWLLEHGYDPWTVDDRGFTPLAWGLLRGEEQGRLLTVFRSYGPIDLVSAVLLTNKDAVERALKEWPRDGRIDGQALHQAVQHASVMMRDSDNPKRVGLIGIVRLMLEGGVSAAGGSPGQWPALCEAVQDADTEMASLLLESGADPSYRHSDGLTVLELAANSAVADDMIRLVRSHM